MHQQLKEIQTKINNSEKINILISMIQQRKTIKNYNQMLEAYQNSCYKITKRYTHQMTQLTSDSIKVLYDLFQSYLSQKNICNDSCQNTQAPSTEQSSNQIIRLNNNKVYEQDNLYCPVSIKKQKGNQDKQNQNLLLSKQIKKLNLGPDYLLIQDDEEEEDEPTRIIKNTQQLKHKKISQMIIQSQKKIRQKNQQAAKNIQQFEDQESQYVITDYSSNQSSNDGSYSPYYAEQTENKPLFGGLFTKTMSTESLGSNSNSSNSNLLNFNFSSKQLLKSPKKLPKNKRLFVGTKKIPKWAEDLDQIQKQCSKQDIKGTSLYGKCIVQHLDTNLIFQDKKQGINRTSSAKWNSQIFLT